MRRLLLLPLMIAGLLSSSVQSLGQNADRAKGGRAQDSRREGEGAGQSLLRLVGSSVVSEHEAVLYKNYLSFAHRRMSARSLPGSTSEKIRPARRSAAQASGGDAPAFASQAAAGTILPGLPDKLIAVVEGARSPVVPHTASSAPIVGPSAVPVASLPAATGAGPAALAAALVRGSQPSTDGLLLPSDTDVGAAAFARGDDVFVVFDAPLPLDLSAVQGDPLGAKSSVELLPAATVIRLAARHADQVRLRRVPSGWMVQAAGPQSAGVSIIPARDNDLLRLPVRHPGRTVIVPDPLTGGDLLVGTLRDGDEAMASTHRGSSATIEQTILGVAVEPLSDRLELHPTDGAFLLSGVAAAALNSPGSAASEAAGGTSALPRVLSLEPGPRAVLFRRFKEAKAAAAQAPSGARFLPRLRAAEDALALGDGSDATTIARVAVADDPRAGGAMRPRLVASAAALLNHQPDPSGLLNDPTMAEAGEPALWRAVKLARQDPASPQAARLFATNLALLLSYPAPLQAMLLPLAVETLVRGGSDAQVKLVDRLPDQPSLDYARALLGARRGQVKPALAALDRLAASPDWVLADEAAETAASIRETQPAPDFKAIADSLEARLLDARIGGHEPASRLHLADLRMRAGQWQQALDLLRETARLYPSEESQARRQVGEVLKRIADGSPATDGGAALAQAAMIEANADMLPNGPEGSRVSLFLASRLAALDLPARAAPIVRDMMRAAGPGADRAELGLKLADLDFQEHDLAGVQSALQESDASNLPPEMVNRRAIMMARALAGEGRLDQALSVLAPLDTVPALDLKASLLALHQDWAGSTDCLIALVRRRLPATGKVDQSDQDMLLRLASAASRTNDPARLSQARGLGDGRFGDGGKAALFNLLTSPSGTNDAGVLTNASEAAALRHASGILDAVAQ